MFNNINNFNPDELKNRSDAELEELCGKIREFLIHSVSKTGGHLASNLGVVELTTAIYASFDLPRDKIIWDVGHQSYVHKILSGRGEGFSSLRKFGGMSGFPKTSESEYDSFNTGHSSTSISAALGIARARDLAGDDYDVIAVFGDGALTGGMMFEALNDAGHSKNKMIAVLNDNAMSISKNVGALPAYLKELRSRPGYYRSKKAVERFLNKIPIIGLPMVRFIKRVKRMIRLYIIPTTIFDDLGFQYLGPVDGHDIKKLRSVFERAKLIDAPVLIHVKTKKGRGYSPAEHNPRKFHGVSEFDVDSGDTKSQGRDYSAVFGEKLTEIASDNDKVAAVTAAMPTGTGVVDFSKKFKDRFFDVGIAEQHAVTMCGGLAITGYSPVFAVYSSFLQRAYDQILHDICLQKLHVVFGVDRAGIVGADGETHQGLYDIAMLMQMPCMSVLSPSNFGELGDMLDYAVNKHDGPIAIRYPRGNIQTETGAEPFSFGKAAIVCEGSDITITAAGRMVKTAKGTANILAKKGISCEIIALRTLKPLDKDTIIKSAKKTKMTVTIEDGTRIGGVGSAILQLFADNNVMRKCMVSGFPDEPITHGSISQLDSLYGMDAKGISMRILEQYTGE
ncbi:MAG: 1-deoxy-D-xylulose-5-phosphate synthase [Oscillospiraceae bacterium]|nr:1-deoxy-D-xylulose-5-phosphate synthase [Oscillospiraceae bacterium]